MSLLGVLRTGVSGMSAQTNRIGTVSENIQNASTTGYKRTSTEFSSLLLDSSGSGTYNSGAVETTIRRSISQEGPIAATNSDTDLAISGSGFFVVRDENTVSYLTRAGNFVTDGRTGNLTNAAGFELLGYSLANGDPTPTLNSSDGMVPINLSSLSMQAKPSTAGTVGGNLDSRAAVATGTDFTKKSSIVTYDNLGGKVKLDVFLTKTAANTWTASVYDSAGAITYPGTALSTTTLNFGATGKITGTATGSVAVPNGNTIPLDFGSLTQLAGDYSLEGAADGNAPSAVKGPEFASDGTVYAVYDDGTRIAAYKIPLGDVTSPDNLNPRAGNVFETTVESGAVKIGFAAAGGLGQLKSGRLEGSNVDMSTELTSMIESQSIYTANSKVFSTGNELLETLMNLKR